MSIIDSNSKAIPELRPTMVIEFDSDGDGKRTERVCHIDYFTGRAVLIEIYGKNACEYWMSLDEILVALRNGSAQIIGKDPFAYLRCPDSFLSKARIRERDKRVAAMQAYIEAHPENQFGDAVIGLLRKAWDRTLPGSHCAKRKAYEFRRLFLQRGMVVNALLSDRCNAGYTSERRAMSPPSRRPGRSYKVVGVPGDPKSNILAIERKRAGIPITEQLRLELFPTIKAARETRDANGRIPKWKDVRRKVCEVHFCSHYEWLDGAKIAIPKLSSLCPTERQIKYICEADHNPVKAIISLRGESAFNKNYRARMGNQRDIASGPGRVVQIDFTLADIFLLDLSRRFIMG